MRRFRRLASILAALGLAVAGLTLAGASVSAANTAPTTPFTQCPPIEQSPSCGLLIVVGGDGGVSVYGDPSVGPFDGIEDTLVGIVNNSSTPLSSLPITSGTDAFGFDGDGFCTIGNPGCITSYEGPGVSFANISADGTSAVVMFNPPLGPGASTYFGLEEALTLVPPNNITPGSPNSGAAVKVADRAQEPVVAIDPTNPKNVVVAYNHLDSAGEPHCGYSRSSDGGATFSATQDLAVPATPGVSGSDGDPALTFSATGKLYFACLAGFDDGTPDSRTALALYTAVSTDAGATFSTPKLVVRGSKSGSGSKLAVVQPDQEQLAAAPTGDQAYMCYAEETKPLGTSPDKWSILLTRLDGSGKRAATGSVTAGLNRTLSLGCTVGVARSGRVWVGWWNAGATVPTADVAYSDVAASANPIPFTGHATLGPKRGTVETDTSGVAIASRHVWVRPSPAAGDGRVAAIWEDDGTTHDLDLAVYTGSSWTPSVALTHDVFQPALAWGADGVIGLGYYQDSSTPPEASSLTYKVAQLSWPDQLTSGRGVASAPSSATANLSPYGRFGDYTSIAEVSGVTAAAWTDNSSGAQTIYFTR